LIKNSTAYMTVMSILAPNLAEPMEVTRTFKYYWLKLLRLRGNPQSLACGAAIGVFIGLTPTIPLHTIALLIITFITRTSTIAALLTSVLVCNPLTYVPIYYFSLVIGNAITPYKLSWQRIKTVLDLLLSDASFSSSFGTITSIGYEAIIIMIVGGTILALPFTIFTYFFTLKLFITIRQKRRKKHLLD